MAMPDVLHGLCQGGPKHGQSLATQAGRRTDVPGNTEGFYVFKPASGPAPAKWIWIKRKAEK